MRAQIDFTANQITGRLLYPLSDGFLNEIVMYNNEISSKKMCHSSGSSEGMGRDKASCLYRDVGHRSDFNILCKLLVNQLELVKLSRLANQFKNVLEIYIKLNYTQAPFLSKKKEEMNQFWK